MEYLTVVLALLGGLAAGALLVHRYLRRNATAPLAPDPVSLEVAAVRDDLQRLTDRFAGETALLGQRLEGRLEGIDSRMTQTQTASAEVAQGIFETLGAVKTATSSVAEQARQFTALQDLLRPPKARGGVGEALLEQLLAQVLPSDAFVTQHRFSSGVVVDAAVSLAGRLVCIDSKFPLANYERMCEATTDVERAEAERAFAADVDKHIKDVSRRYIVPDEETFEFAVMYVPAEGVYGEVLRLKHRQQPLCDIARAAHVIPMSPLTMYGYLQTICLGLRGLRIEKSAEKILDFCGRLQQDLERFTDEYDTLGRHLTNARGKYEEGSRRLDRFRDKLERVVDLADDDEDRRPSLEVVGE